MNFNIFLLFLIIFSATALAIPLVEERDCPVKCCWVGGYCVCCEKLTEKTKRDFVEVDGIFYEKNYVSA
ncbi:hypothetical protein RIR_jg32637.t1 [Rhizophagus irregularis DAOM 181602=DAOM 197198]|nr:hypothetical protein RIR_jg32637.t1 [Rhizophagus irregularis DAOM 181602=DAOM 197198]